MVRLFCRPESKLCYHQSQLYNQLEKSLLIGPDLQYHETTVQPEGQGDKFLLVFSK